MSKKKGFPKVAWGFLLVLISFVGLVYFSGGSRVTEELIRHKLLQSYGLSETQLDRLSLAHIHHIGPQDCLPESV